MVALVKAKVTLYTDSATTIIGFDQLDNFMNLSVRKKAKIPNFQI